MKTTRLEAFSGGVITILITIMVLELKAPHGETRDALRPLLPVVLSYALNFVYRGIYWNNHHHMLHTTERVTGPMLWADLHLLCWLSLIPFTTGWMGENHVAAAPAAWYGGVLLMSAIAYAILEKLMIASHGEHSVLKKAIGRDWKGKASIAMYSLAILSSFVSQKISVTLYVLVAVMWLVSDKRIERAWMTGFGIPAGRNCHQSLQGNKERPCSHSIPPLYGFTCSPMHKSFFNPRLFNPRLRGTMLGIAASVMLLHCAASFAGESALDLDTSRAEDAHPLYFQTSVATQHFHPSSTQNNHQDLLNLEWNYRDNLVVGGAWFRNTFEQPTKLVYWGAKFHPVASVPDAYVKVVGGLLHGYKGEYRDKIPFNGSGTAPVVLPAVGYCYKRACSELIVFGTAGAILTAGLRF
jgi:uncharacterized membrane protein